MKKKKVDKQNEKSIEERLSLLESRLDLLQPKKSSAEVSSFEKTLSKVGLAYLLVHASQKLEKGEELERMNHIFREILGCEITKENRFECANKIFKLSLAFLDEAANNLNKQKN